MLLTKVGTERKYISPKPSFPYLIFSGTVGSNRLYSVNQTKRLMLCNNPEGHVFPEQHKELTKIVLMWGPIQYMLYLVDVCFLSLHYNSSEICLLRR